MNDEEGKLEDERIDEITQKQEFDKLQVLLYHKTFTAGSRSYEYFVRSYEYFVRICSKLRIFCSHFTNILFEDTNILFKVTNQTLGIKKLLNSSNIMLTANTQAF